MELGDFRTLVTLSITVYRIPELLYFMSETHTRSSPTATGYGRGIRSSARKIRASRTHALYGNTYAMCGGWGGGVVCRRGYGNNCVMLKRNLFPMAWVFGCVCVILRISYMHIGVRGNTQNMHVAVVPSLGNTCHVSGFYPRRSQMWAPWDTFYAFFTFAISRRQCHSDCAPELHTRDK